MRTMGSTSDDGLLHHGEEENQDGFPKYFRGFGVSQKPLLTNLSCSHHLHLTTKSRKAKRCEITKLIPIKRIHHGALQRQTSHQTNSPKCSSALQNSLQNKCTFRNRFSSYRCQNNVSLHQIKSTRHHLHTRQLISHRYAVNYQIFSPSFDG